MIDAFVGSQTHYAEHITPILDALPADRRGRVYTMRNLKRDMPGSTDQPVPQDTTDPILVGGFTDLPRCGRRPKVLVQHGAGQTYVSDNDSGSYVGGAGHESVDLFICPNERSADLERARYPHADAVAVGCPKLDEWRTVPMPRNGVVAVTFHWDCHYVPEARWAWPTWREAVAELARVRPVLGHAHPRAARELEPWWETIGVEYVARARELLDRADVLVADNTSLAYEWAACDRPVVFIDSEFWRRDARHGLRFGEPLPGPTAGADGSVPVLRDLVRLSAADPGRWAERRREVSERVYACPSGRSAPLAAAAVLALAERGPRQRTYRTAGCRSC